MSVPYETATSGERARGEIRKHLQRFGCETVGFMDEFAEQRLLLAFPVARASGAAPRVRARPGGAAPAGEPVEQPPAVAASRSGKNARPIIVVLNCAGVSELA